MPTPVEEVVFAPLREEARQIEHGLTPKCGFPAVDLIDAVTQREMRAGRTRARVRDLLAGRNLLGPPVERRGKGGAVLL
jgi:hypothetical protein